MIQESWPFSTPETCCVCGRNYEDGFTLKFNRGMAMIFCPEHLKIGEEIFNRTARVLTMYRMVDEPAPPKIA